MDWAWTRDGQSLATLDLMLRGDLPSSELRFSVTDVHTGECTLKLISLPASLAAGAVYSTEDTELALSAHAEFITCTGYDDARFTVIIDSESGEVFFRTSELDDPGDRGDRWCVPAWHPSLPIIAYFAGGQLRLHNLESNLIQMVFCKSDLSQPLDGWDVQSIESWSACESLLSFTVSNEEQIMVVVVKTNGHHPCEVLPISSGEVQHVFLSDATSDLLGVWFGGNDKSSKVNIAVYKISTGVLVFQQSMQHGMVAFLVAFRPLSASTFLFGTPLMCLASASSQHGYDDRASSRSDPLRLLDMQSVRQVCRLDQELMLSQTSNCHCPLVFGVCNSTGNKLLIVGQVRGREEAGNCARLYSA